LRLGRMLLRRGVGIRGVRRCGWRLGLGMGMLWMYWLMLEQM
jgi:hypothetical protein